MEQQSKNIKPQVHLGHFGLVLAVALVLLGISELKDSNFLGGKRQAGSDDFSFYADQYRQHVEPLEQTFGLAPAPQGGEVAGVSTSTVFEAGPGVIHPRGE